MGLWRWQGPLRSCLGTGRRCRLWREGLEILLVTLGLFGHDLTVGLAEAVVVFIFATGLAHGRDKAVGLFAYGLIEIF
jgi:hypothetical protein